MYKYIYVMKDSNDQYCCSDFTREGARKLKRNAEKFPYFFREVMGEVPPYKIVRYELSNPKVVR